MKVYIHNSLIFPLRIVQEIGEDEGTACGRSDSAAENKISSLFLIYLPLSAAMLRWGGMVL